MATMNLCRASQKQTPSQCPSGKNKFLHLPPSCFSFCYVHDETHFMTKQGTKTLVEESQYSIRSIKDPALFPKTQSKY